MKTTAKRSLKPCTDFLGLDTETVEGYARILCLSDGRVFEFNKPSDVIYFLTSFKLVTKTYFFAWNADFDIQALLKWLPKKLCRILLKGIETILETDGEGHGISLQYIKGKFLQFDGNYIFDALQYYGTSLKEASVKYLP